LDYGPELPTLVYIAGNFLLLTRYCLTGIEG